MGNNITRERFTRNDSKRFSRRTPKEKRENQENPKIMNEPKMKSRLQTEEVKENMETSLQSLRKKISRHGDDLACLVEAFNILKERADEVSKILNDNINKNDAGASPEGNIVVQENTIRKAVDILKSVQNNTDLNRLENSLAEVRQEIDICLDKFRRDFNAIDTQHNMHILEQLQKDLSKCRNENRKLEKQMKRLKEPVELEDNSLENVIRQPPSVPATVQLYYIHGGEVMKEVEGELIMTLRHKIGPMNFVICRSPSDIDEEKLLIVLCAVMTRLRADAASVIKDIKNPVNAALLIIHNTESHSVTNQKSSLHLTDREFKNFRGIFDMKFMSGYGFFPCLMNDRSFKEICSFCKQQPFGERL